MPAEVVRGKPPYSTSIVTLISLTALGDVIILIINRRSEPSPPDCRKPCNTWTAWASNEKFLFQEVSVLYNAPRIQGKELLRERSLQHRKVVNIALGYVGGLLSKLPYAEHVIAGSKTGYNLGAHRADAHYDLLIQKQRAALKAIEGFFQELPVAKATQAPPVETPSLLLKNVSQLVTSSLAAVLIPSLAPW